MEHQKKLFLVPKVIRCYDSNEFIREYLRFSELIISYISYLRNCKSFQKWKLTWYLKQAPQNTSKYQISAKSMKGFGSYEHMKFRPMRRLKYKLWSHNYVIVVTSQTFLLPLCSTVHNTSSLIPVPNFMIIGAISTKLWWGPSCPPMTDGSKKAHVK